MKFILDHLAIGSYEEALRPSSEITALLNVAKEKDLKTSLLYHKVPIIHRLLKKSFFSQTRSWTNKSKILSAGLPEANRIVF